MVKTLPSNAGSEGLIPGWETKIPHVMVGVVKIWGFPGSSDGKESACNAGDQSSIPGLGRSPGEGNDNSLQYSCLENPRDREASQSRVHGAARIRHLMAE